MNSNFSALTRVIALGLIIAFNAIAAAPDFEAEVAPLLIKRCVECHQGDDPSSGLNLTHLEGFQKSGKNGADLLDRVIAGEMPPEKQGRSQQLPDDEIAVLRAWIESGANWPVGRVLDYFERTNNLRAGRDWWSLQPIVRPEIPKLKTRPQPENPVDAFIGAKLEAENATSAPPADRRTLIRRVYYNLIGLPPTEAEITAFANDDSPDAWPKLIDDLLTKPQYGERWGRFWLDLARYADTSGYERDQEKPFAWKYRDWVVNALNEDMPYEQFIIEQLAGDEIPDPTEQSVIATGFLRLGTWNDEPNDAADYQFERLEDMVHTTSSAFLALTVKCARCHNHKFDAITQEDYYRMASAFWAGPVKKRSSKLVGGPSAEELGFPNVLGWTDLGAQPEPLRLLKNGERHHPMHEVAPASLSSIPSLEKPFDPPPEGAKTTHRRLQLARWIASPENPLTARVMVNRIWQHHFGQAIVRTPNNFGFLADPPTHRQLLDWLAAEFLARGGRMKEMHRLILTSETWRQSSLHPNASTLEQRDSGNRWWWRSERRRLDAETLRDSLLAASGELELTVGGAGFKPTISQEALEGLSRKSSAWVASPPEQQLRRSIYVFLKRGLLPPMMTTFDLCDPTLSCGKRDVTILPAQALTLLNNDFVHSRSQRLASAISAEAAELDGQVRLAWSRVLKRQPNERELASSLAHIAAQIEAFNAPVAETPAPAEDSLTLHLRADKAKVVEGRVESLEDLSGRSHHASQAKPESRPELKPDGFGGQPVLIFDGQARFFEIAGQLLETPGCTIIAVVSDNGNAGHREVISNWNGNGNSISSVFLGLTAENKVRFSDGFSPAGEVANRAEPFLISAVNSFATAMVFQNGKLLKSGKNLTSRRLDTPWVLGQQGNINGEYWNGGIAEIRVYDRDLSHAERSAVEREMAERYGLTLTEFEPEKVVTTQTLALASLCHVLMNSNEFMYVD
ncbi:MAG: DUF1553 domain-containing protein [Verrucomicrobiota bacterium]